MEKKKPSLWLNLQIRLRGTFPRDCFCAFWEHNCWEQSENNISLLLSVSPFLLELMRPSLLSACWWREFYPWIEFPQNDTKPIRKWRINVDEGIHKPSRSLPTSDHGGPCFSGIVKNVWTMWRETLSFSSKLNHTYSCPYVYRCRGEMFAGPERAGAPTRHVSAEALKLTSDEHGEYFKRLLHRNPDVYTV